MNETQTSSGSGKIKAKRAKPQRKRELIPVGDYLFRVDWVEKTFSKKKGKPRLSFRFRVAAGELKDKRAFQDCYLTDAAVWKLQNLAILCGVPEDQEIDPDDKKGLINMFQGKEFHGYVTARAFKTEDGTEVETRDVGWNVPEGAGDKPDETDDDNADASEGEDAPGF